MLLKVTAPVNAFAWVKVMSASSAKVVNALVPVTVNAPPAWVMFPALAVTSRSPPTVLVPKSIAALFTTVASPVPFVVKTKSPVLCCRLPRLITPSLSSVVKITSPATTKFPLSVIPATLPLVAVKVPSIVDAAKSKAVVPLSITTFPALPFVVTVRDPVNAFAWFKVISASSAEVVKLDAPPTFNAPL